ncbi:MAG: hypothetical protein DWQ04_33675 [Chloroflexi bacterium]|nr:MAG: hypothetical protein DWQ04_33675 [Chloroflexota bacterium]
MVTSQPTSLPPDREIGLFWNYLVNNRVVSSPSRQVKQALGGLIENHEQMKLIIIYGPEATGKLTIAKKLSKATGFRLFHNHVSVDVAKTFFDFGMAEFGELVWDVRILALEHAARGNIPGVIFTWAYSHPDFQPYLNRLRELCAKHNIEISYVHVSCSINELKKRVLQSDRKAVGKINTVEALERQLEHKNHQVIPDTDSLIIDNTALSPQDAAKHILEHLKI